MEFNDRAIVAFPLTRNLRYANVCVLVPTRRSGSEQRHHRSPSRGENNTVKYLMFALSAALILTAASIGLDAQAPPKAPRFEVDRKLPQIPNNWALGEVTPI